MATRSPWAARLALAAGFAALAGLAIWQVARRTAPEATGGRTAPAVAEEAPGLAGKGAAPARARGAGVTLAGIVVRDGAPARAKVTARRSPRREGSSSSLDLLEPLRPADPVVAEAESGADGRFALRGIEAGSVALEAVAPDGARGRTAVDVEGYAPPRDARILLLGATGTLRGRVVTTKGAPWSGSVRVVTDPAGPPPYDRSNAYVLALVTDAEGKFEATGLRGDRVAVHAMEEGTWCVAGPSARLPYGGEYRLVVPDASDAISGTVVDDATGAPIAAAEVAFSPDAYSSTAARATTGADGRFRLLTLDSNAEIEARAAGYVQGVAIQAERGRDVRVALLRTATLRVRVTADPDGRPVAGVGIYVAAGRSSPRRVGSTDAEGRYAVRDVWPGEVAVYAFGDGWVQKGLEDVRTAGWNPFALSLEPGREGIADRTVVPGARAVGHVTDAEGRPVEAATLRADPVAPTGDGVGPLGSLLPGASARSATDGGFALSGLVPGVAYAFRAHVADLPPHDAGTRVATGAQPVVLEIQLAPVARVEVTVREKGSGRPIAGASVRAGSHYTWTFRDAVVADEKGLAVLGPLYEGSWCIDVEADGFVGEDWFDVECRVSPPTTAFAVNLVRSSTIAGVVRRADGTPAAGAVVDLDSEDGWSIEAQREACDGLGQFHFDGLRPGTHFVGATLDSAQATTRVEAGRTDVVLVLPAEEKTPPSNDEAPPPPGLVTVLDPSGRPVPRAMLCIRGPERNAYRHWAVVRDGRAEIHDREELGWILEVKWPTTEGGTPLAAGVGWGRWGTSEATAEIRLPAEAPIEGTVLDAGGRPVEGVLLEAVPARVPEPQARRIDEEVVARARSGPGGAFRLRGTGPEAYRLSVRPPTGSAPPEPVVAEGGAKGVVVRLRPGVAPTITVLDADGRPVADAIVSVTVGPHETYVEWPDSVVTELNEGGLVRTGAEGTARLASLDPTARYDLYVGRPRERKDVLGLDTPDWAPADATIRLPRGLKVRGTVRDPDGQPVERAEVSMRRGDAPAKTAWTAPDGAFEFELVPEGRVDLSARLPSAEGDADPLPASRASADAGAENVLLVVRAGADLRLRIAGWNRWNRRGSWVALTREPADDGADSHDGIVEDDDSVRFRGLTAGAAYVLWGEPDEDGRFVYAAGLRPGAKDVVVRAEFGRPLSGLVNAPPGAKPASVRAAGPGWTLWTSAGADGRYAFRGVPAGPCRVTAWAEVGDDTWSAEREASAGDVVDLVVQPPKK